MTGLIINNMKPNAVTVEHDGQKKTFPSFLSACEYADAVREKRFPVWPNDQIDLFDEARMDIIGQNGNDGLHYDGVGADWLREHGQLEAGQ